MFTVPHELNPLARNSPARFYDLLFAASSQTLLEVAADPKRLGAEIGFLSILHSWGSERPAPSPCPLCRPRRRILPRPPALDPHPSPLPAAHPGAPPRLSRQVPLRAQAPLQQRIAGLQRSRSRLPGSGTVRRTDRAIAATRSGSSMPSRPSADPHMCSAIWAATPIASPFPITACWPSTGNASPSARRIMPTAANRAS